MPLGEPQNHQKNRQRRGLRRSRWPGLLGALAGALLGLQLIFGPLSDAAARTPLAQSTSAGTGSIESLQRQQQQLEQQRRTIQQERDRLQTLEGDAKNELSSLKDSIDVTAEQVAETEQRLSAAQGELESLQKDLATAKAAHQDHQYATVARLRFLQRQTVGQGWAVLLQSDNLNEFLDRRRQLSLIYATDREILTGLAQETVAIERSSRDVERKKNDIALLRQRLLLQKSEYEAQAQEQGNLVVRLQQDRKALEEAEARLAQDSESLTDLIRQRIAASQQIALGSGQMVFPTRGQVTSRFGWRVHPILGSRRFHAGLDFGASQGTPILAADAGQVLFAGWYGGYGRAVVINHGNGVTTLYGHASRVYVSEGETVQRGQTIAAVGSTGLSTGPHLHFEVRRDGAPVNPAAYL
ncbi:MAG: murein hydrolase activator EnvC family protein [Elainellaceae cyanobacterium]